MISPQVREHYTRRRTKLHVAFLCGKCKSSFGECLCLDMGIRLQGGDGRRGQRRSPRPEHGFVHGEAQHHKHRGANAGLQPEGGALQISLGHVTGERAERREI